MDLELATLIDIHRELRRRYQHVMIILAGTEAGDSEPSFQILDKGCPSEAMLELAKFALAHPEEGKPIVDTPVDET